MQKHKQKLVWYAKIIFIILTGEIVFFKLCELSQYSPTGGWLRNTIDNLKIFWILSLPYVFFNIWGLVFYGPAKKPELANKNPKSKNITLRISYCTKGNNHLSLRRGLRSVQKALNQKLKKEKFINLFNKVEIEVVSDNPLPEKTFPIGLKVKKTIVPANYQTKNATLFKARAIQYSIEKNSCSPNTFILRLDEESLIDTSTLLGVSEFFENRSENEVIGQGEILYNSYQYGNRISIAAADAIRTGDDLGRFRLQYKLGGAWFGMHGSFVLIRSDIEKEIGYDHGPKSSITEDTYLALKIMEKGYKYRWINGYVYEQSPYTFRELIKQRRRWFLGITEVIQDQRISVKNRIVLFTSHFIWMFSSISFMVTILNLIFPSPTSFILGLSGGLVFSCYLLIYIIGTGENLHNINFNLKTRLYLYLITIVCLPLSTLLETGGVITALFRKQNNFEVVNKN